MLSSMKFLLLSVALVAVFQSAKAAVASERVVPTRDEHDKCVRARDRVNLDIGQTELREGCSKVSCRTTDGQLFIDEESCGIVSGTPGCRRVEDKSKTYPDCCPQVKC